MGVALIKSLAALSKAMASSIAAARGLKVARFPFWYSAEEMASVETCSQYCAIVPIANAFK